MSTGINGIKISELDKSTDLTNTQILSSYIPIVVGDKNYKMQFSERLYSISEIENKLSTLELKILEISSDDDGSDGKLILERLENFDKHISGLIDGPFVLDETSDVKEESNGYDGLKKYNNTLYKPLTSDKILISNNNGKLSTSEINADKLEYLNLLDDWSEQYGSTSLASKINELENKVKTLENTKKLGFINYNESETITINVGTNSNPKDLKGNYSYIDYTPEIDSWVFAQFMRGNGGNADCGPTVYFKNKEETIDDFKFFKHVASYDYGLADVFLPVKAGTTIRILAIGGSLYQAKAWPMT
jgi:hypothetical protein